MEEYKKKYEEALEKAKEEIKKCGDNKGRIRMIENIFPELKESEDERIRKSIIDLVEKQMPKSENKKWMIAWLEKQGEKIDVIENFDTEFEKQVSHLIASAINKEHEYNQSYVKWTANALLNYAKHELEKQGEQSIYDVPSRNMILAVWELGNEWKELTNGSISKEYGTQLEYIQKHWNESQYYLRDKQGEQKPAWSEEDEDNYVTALWHIKKSSGREGSVYNWLKSLKERYTWKPSDEQIEALLKLEEMHVLEHEKNQENAHLYMVIKNIREQLQKLRKE